MLISVFLCKFADIESIKHEICMKILKKLFAATMMMACPVSMAAQDENFYIFLCIGQSNMVGQGEITKADKQDVSDRFLSLSAVNGKDRKLGQWRKAVPPLCREDTKYSLVDYFGRTMLENLPEKARVGVIHIAVDGCGIDLFDKDLCRQYVANVTQDWMKKEIAAYDGNPYQRLIQLAEMAQEEGDIRGILLHQGETDAYNDEWIRKVKKIYNDIIHDLDLDPVKVPLIAGEAVGEDQNGICAHANPTINRLPIGFQQCFVVSSKGCQAGPDRLHFTADGYRELGRRYAVKMLQALGYELTDHRIQVIEPNNVPTIDVTASIDDSGIFFAQADGPLQKVDVVSYSGQTLTTINCNGKETFTFNTLEYPDENKLVFVFYGQNGATESLELNRR